MKTNYALKKVVVKAIALGLLALPMLVAATPAQAGWVDNEYGGYADDYYSEPTDGSKSMNELLLRDARKLVKLRKANMCRPRPKPSARW
jgi:hypothetical protein